MLGFAAEFEIDRPTTEAGWIALILVGVLLLFLLTQGLHSLSGMAEEPLKRNTLFFLVLVILLFVAANRDNWGADPLVELEVLDESDVGGTQAESDPGHHDIDPDHTHDSNN